MFLLFRVLDTFAVKNKNIQRVKNCKVRGEKMEAIICLVMTYLST